MFEWFRKYVRKIGIFGVEVEFHPPTESSASITPLTPRKLAEPSEVATSAYVPATSVTDVQVSNLRSGAVAADRDAFLEQVKNKKNGEAERVADYARVLDDLIAWSEAQGGLLIFSPKPAKNSQATVMYRFRGRDFWDAYPNKQLPAKFCYEYKFERAYLLAEFAKLSADGRPASETVPTVWLRDLVSEAVRQRLKQLLGEVLGRLASQPAVTSDNAESGTVPSTAS